MALKKVKGTLERVLDKNLQDLVRGIRNHKESESKYIAECVDEIKQELRQDNIAVKANAVSKLCYIQMIGYDISWASFNIIEVMSSSKFTYKRIGYMAASQTFHEGTDVLMLTTNMIRKDLGSQNMYDAGVALNSLSCFLTQDLARDLANDIMTLMTSTKPYLRKKAVLLMYKVFLRFPEALRPAFPRLKEKLEDPDSGVQSAAVNVICELARKNPQNYLSLAPLFFKLMTSSTNNWVLIKIIKLFGALTPLEPRLGKKLIEPLTNLIHSTSAMSLLYECINTVIAGIPDHSASIQLCVQKLRILIEDSDQNLKYLGLLAMSRILKTHPKSVQGHKDLVVSCLDDKDDSIRLRALDLIYGMVSKKNLMEIVKKLMVHMDKAEGSNYRDELLCKIIEICSQSNYQYITNFEWYVSVLVELTRVEGTKHGRLVASQMLDVAIRVQAIRNFAVSQMALLLENSISLQTNSQKNGICEVLYAAAWICGEFAPLLAEPRATLEAMLKPKVTSLPGHIQAVYVQNVLKLYAAVLLKAEEEQDEETAKETSALLLERLPMFSQSSDLEVQERACSGLQLLKYVTKLQEKGQVCGSELSALFSGDLNPVAVKAQKKVPVPEGLDLDAWINAPPSDSSEDEDFKPATLFATVGSDYSYHTAGDRVEKRYEPTAEELEKQRETRRQEQESNPHYIKPSKPSKQHYTPEEVSQIPTAELKLDVPLHVPGFASSDKYLQEHKQAEAARRNAKDRHKKHKKNKKRSKKQQISDSESDMEVPVSHVVNTALDVPEGVHVSDGEDHDKRDASDPHRALDINLDDPLRDDEVLPVRIHREAVILNEADNEGGLDVVVDKKPRKQKKIKKVKKEKKRKHNQEQPDDGPDLIGQESADITANNVDHVETPAARSNNEPAPQQTEEQAEDLEFWLNNDAIPKVDNSSKGTASTPTVAVSPPDDNVADDGTDERTKKKKSKKEKKKKSRKDKRGEYEQTEGIVTPSKEQLPPSLAATPTNFKLPPMSGYKRLAESQNIRLTYETRARVQDANRIGVSVIFHNLTDDSLTNLEFNTMDSLNIKLVRDPGAASHDPIKVPFVLTGQSQNECFFAFSVADVTSPQRLKGTLTYMHKSAEGATHEKLDFKIQLSVASYLVGMPCNSDAFAKLLGSGELTEKTSISLQLEDCSLPQILAKICFFAHFTVVEQIDDSASLFSKSIQSHVVCLLVKMQNKQLSIDGKSADSSLLNHVISDIQTLLS